MSDSSISPKVLASTVGAALATIIWVVVAVVWPSTFTETQLAALTGASTTVLSFILGWAISDPLRRAVADSMVDPTRPQDGAR